MSAGTSSGASTGGDIGIISGASGANGAGDVLIATGSDDGGLIQLINVDGVNTPTMVQLDDDTITLNAFSTVDINTGDVSITTGAATLNMIDNGGSSTFKVIAPGGSEFGTGGLLVSADGLTISAGGLYVNGDITVTGDVIYSGSITATTTTPSDRRLKADIVPLENSLEKVSKIRGVYFSWAEDEEVGMKLSDGHRHVGVIAQEVRDVLPEVVREIEDGQYFGVQYSELIPLVLDAVRELDEKVNGIKIYDDTVIEFQSTLESILERVAALEKNVLELKKMATEE